MKRSTTVALSAALGLALVLPSHGWAQDYIVRAVSNGGSIAGSVMYAGGAVERSPVNVTTDQEVCDQTPKLSAELIVDPTSNTIQNVVVSIKGISGGKNWSLPEEGLTFDQRGCSFNPHVLVVRAGQSFNILNSDGILHNVHTHGRNNRPVNKAQPKFLTTLPMKLNEAEFVRVTCNVHSWMEGWIVVAEHPYYAVSDKNGSFQIDNVPPGDYTLEFWHEKLGVQSRSITIAAAETVQVDVTFSVNE